MIKRLFLLILFGLSCTLYSQYLNVSHPKVVESYVGQSVNLPIICENMTGQTISIYPDYHSIFYDAKQGYQLNRLSPKQINPSRKELIFVNLSPNPQMKAGKRFFPFVIKEEGGSVLYNGVFEINHIVHEAFEMIPLRNYRYLLSGVDEYFSVLFLNSGTVPVEFKTDDYKYVQIIQPGKVDTLNIKFSEINNIERNEFFVSFVLNYSLTSIMPNELIVTKNSMHHFIPIAHKTEYPRKKDYIRIPASLTQSITYDENHYGEKYTFYYYHALLYGSGYLDNQNSPYLAYQISYRYRDTYDKSQEFNYHILYRSLGLSFEAGEGTYLLDLKKSKKYGDGYSLSLNIYGFIAEGVFLQELYDEKPVHSSVSMTYAWDLDSYIYEPKSYVRVRHYQKNSKDHENKWWKRKIGGHESIEHQKVVVESQVNILDMLRMQVEVFSAQQDDHEAKFGNNTGVSSEIQFNSLHFYNKFSLLYDDINIYKKEEDDGKTIEYKESDYRKLYQNDMNITTKNFDLYTSAQYQEEHTQASPFTDYEYTAANFNTNVYQRIYKPMFLRGKFYMQETEILSPNKSKFNALEALAGTMFKNSFLEAEALYGIKKEKWRNSEEIKHRIADFNIAATKYDKNTFSLNFSNRVNFLSQEKTISSFLSIFNRWVNNMSQSYGVYNHYNSLSSWRDNLSCFTNVFFKLPWNHDLRVGASYNVNPKRLDSYLFSVVAEYTMPLSFNLLPVSNKKYMNISVFDPWAKKPVSDAVFYIDNQYYVTNDNGLIRPRKTQTKNQIPQLINIPEGFTTVPDLNTLKELKGNRFNVRIVNYSKLEVKVMKMIYDRVSPTDAIKLSNLAYFQNNIVNMDRFIMVECSDTIELILRSVKNSAIIHRAMVNPEGVALFTGLREGEYQLLFNPASNPDLVLNDEKIIIKINANETEKYELNISEKVTRFIKFE